MSPARPSPNIWRYPHTYELENRWMDPDGVVLSAIRDLHDWTGQTVLDIGCGTGFHLPTWAAVGRVVIGLEPHPPLALAAGARLPRDRARRAVVVRGLAEQLPLADRSVDLAHARWAYFFGPGCEPGLAELDRVMREGGTAVVLDHDATRSTFGRWFRREWPAYDPDGVARFWRRHGWSRRPLLLTWRLPSRADFEAVVRIEFTPQTADVALAEQPGTGVDHAVNLWWRRF